MGPKPFVSDDGDVFWPASYLSEKIRALTNHPGPGVRALIYRAASARLAPPMERSEDGNWGCWNSKLAALCDKLGLSVLSPPSRAKEPLEQTVTLPAPETVAVTRRPTQRQVA